jgi:hypothetical protein
MSLFVHSLHCGPLGEESCVVFLSLALVEICDFVTNEFATSCDYLTFTTTVGYIYNYCLHLKPLATIL